MMGLDTRPEGRRQVSRWRSRVSFSLACAASGRSSEMASLAASGTNRSRAAGSAAPWCTAYASSSSDSSPACGVPFIDSSGLGVLVGVLNQLRRDDRPAAHTRTMEPSSGLHSAIACIRGHRTGVSPCKATAESADIRRAIEAELQARWHRHSFGEDLRYGLVRTGPAPQMHHKPRSARVT
jgi:hypothetical protein